MELGGTTPGSGHDQIAASGVLTLDGTLQVALAVGFNPAAGDSFDLFDWTSVSGTFDSLVLPALTAGLTWNTSQLYVSGILSVAPGLSGDYNYDGAVDAADYVVWRKGIGTESTPANYNLWRTNFGRMIGGGAAARLDAAVPEPAALPLALLAVAFGARRQRRSTVV
jgi:hypothetical protein